MDCRVQHQGLPLLLQQGVQYLQCRFEDLTANHSPEGCTLKDPQGPTSWPSKSPDTNTMEAVPPQPGENLVAAPQKPANSNVGERFPARCEGGCILSCNRACEHIIVLGFLNHEVHPQKRHTLILLATRMSNQLLQLLMLDNYIFASHAHLFPDIHGRSKTQSAFSNLPL